MNTSLQLTHPIAKIDALQSLLRDDSVRVVDTRRSQDYAKGHITGAVSIPLRSVLDERPEKVVELLTEVGIGDETPVIVYDDSFGAVAARVAWALRHIGHPNVSILEVTYSTWASLGLDCDESESSFPSVHHLLRVDDNILATTEYVKKSLDKDDRVLIDARERLNYLQSHIPKAQNLSWRMLAGGGRIFRPDEELKRILKGRDIPQDSEVITYCGSVGTLSSLAFYALRIAGFRVRLYAKSMNEWRSRSLPLESVKDAHYWDLSAE